jgi:predicted enzyme related to lactoylglutathione lyase
MSGRIVHFEIPFEDQDRANAFYTKAFNWQLASMPGMGYTLVTTGPSSEETGPTEPGYINGGMLQRQEPITSPVLVIDVGDIDATLAQIGELGGSTVRGREPVGDMGFAAYFTDSEGNLIGLWETASG